MLGGNLERECLALPSGFALCLIMAACGAIQDSSCPAAHLKSIRGEENVRVSPHWVTQYGD